MEAIDYTKFYVRANNKGIVDYTFLELFEKPLAKDIYVDTTKFDWIGLTDENGIFNYKIENGQLVKRDKTADIQIMANNVRIFGLKQLLKDSDYKALKFCDGALTSEEYEPTRVQRQAWRDEINALEEDVRAWEAVKK